MRSRRPSPSARSTARDHGRERLRSEDHAKRLKLLRSHALTSGTWDRHKGHSAGYDVVDVGFNLRTDEPRAALALSRLETLDPGA